MLALEKLLIETDSDQPVVATVTVGFDDSSSLVFRLERTDYDQPERSFVKSAQIGREDAYQLAKANALAERSFSEGINSDVVP